MDTPAAGHLSMLRDYQARTFQSIARAMRRRRGETQTVLFPRQAGKNEVAAVLVAFLLLTHAWRGGSVVVCAPTVVPQAEISRRRTLAALRSLVRLVPAVRPIVEGQDIRVGRATATFLSASTVAHVAGHTASIALIADEAQDIEEEWFDRQFRPMAASTRAPVVLFGTPWDGETLLDHAVARNRVKDEQRTGGSSLPFLPLHHQAAWAEVALTNPLYGEYVAQERERLGVRHPLFVTQYGLECVADAGRLFTAEDLERLNGCHERESEPSSRGIRYVAGLDVGGEGKKNDASVLTIARVVERRCEVVTHVAWEGSAESQIALTVAALAVTWRLERLCVDSTGIGQPLAKELEREVGDRIEGVHFTANVKSELGYAMLAAVRTGRLALYADDHTPESRACRAELAACRAQFSGPALQWSAPSGRHDDYAVSLALCLRAAESLGAPRVAVGRTR